MTTPIDVASINDPSEVLLARIEVYHIKGIWRIFGENPLTFTGIAADPTKVELAFNYDPILTGDALVVSNWSIIGLTTVTISTITTSGNRIVINMTGTAPNNIYTVNIPNGIVADTGDATPTAYLGPFQVIFGGAATGGGSAFNRGFN